MSNFDDLNQEGWAIYSRIIPRKRCFQAFVTLAPEILLPLYSNLRPSSSLICHSSFESLPTWRIRTSNYANGQRLSGSMADGAGIGPKVATHVYRSGPSRYRRTWSAAVYARGQRSLTGVITASVTMRPNYYRTALLIDSMGQSSR